MVSRTRRTILLQVYVMERFTYARWVSNTIKSFYLEDNQETRDKFYTNSGRVANYPYYVQYCEDNDHEPDNPPKGYKMPKGSKLVPIGLAVGAWYTLLFWFLGSVAVSGTGRSKKS